MAKPAVYEIRISSAVEVPWTRWFSGLTVRETDAGEVVITTEPIDAATLYGILAVIRDLNCALLMVRNIDADDRED